MRDKKTINKRIRDFEAFGHFAILSWIWSACGDQADGRKLHSAVAVVKEIYAHEDTRRELLALARKAMAHSDRKEGSCVSKVGNISKKKTNA